MKSRKTPICQNNQASGYPYSSSEYVRRFAWEWIERLCFRPSPRRSFRWRRFLLKCFGVKMGWPSGIAKTTTMIHPWLLTVGHHSMIGERVRIYNLGPITIGDHTVISQDVSLCAGTHDYTDPAFPLVRSRISIGNGVWICAEAFIGPDVTIGDGAVVGARAVVTKDVSPWTVVAGNPAKFIKKREIRKGPVTVG